MAATDSTATSSLIIMLTSSVGASSDSTMPRMFSDAKTYTTTRAHRAPFDRLAAASARTRPMTRMPIATPVYCGAPSAAISRGRAAADEFDSIHASTRASFIVIVRITRSTTSPRIAQTASAALRTADGVVVGAVMDWLLCVGVGIPTRSARGPRQFRSLCAGKGKAGLQLLASRDERVDRAVDVVR